MLAFLQNVPYYRTCYLLTFKSRGEVVGGGVVCSEYAKPMTTVQVNICVGSKWLFFCLCPCQNLDSCFLLQTRFVSQQYEQVSITCYLCFVSIQSVGSWQFVGKNMSNGWVQRYVPSIVYFLTLASLNVHLLVGLSREKKMLEQDTAIQLNLAQSRQEVKRQNNKLHPVTFQNKTLRVDISTHREAGCLPYCTVADSNCNRRG